MTASATQRRLRIGVFYNLREDFPWRQTDPADAAADWDIPETIEFLLNGFEAAGHSARNLGNPLRLLEAEVREEIDLVLSLCELAGTRFRESLVPALCELLKLPFMLSGPDALLIALDKNLANLCLRQAGVPVAAWQLVGPGDQRMEDFLPAVIKPQAEGSGMGVQLARSQAESEVAIARIHRDYRQPALVQKYLPGREFTVGIIERTGRPVALAALEVVPLQPGEDFLYNFSAKENSGTTVEFCPVPDPKLSTELRSLAVDAFTALGCRDAARVDLRMDDLGQVQILELNPLPHLHPEIGDFCRSALASGTSYPELLAEMVTSASERWSL